MDAEELYRFASSLWSTFPEFNGNLFLDEEDNRWLGRLHALLSEQFLAPEVVMLEGLIKKLRHPDALIRDKTADEIKTILFKSLASAELEAPVSVRGAFIPAGNAFDALNSPGKILRQASRELLIVDPYMSDKGLTDYCVLANEAVAIKLLADSKSVKPSLEPAIKAWTRQYGNARPLEVRLASSGTLHDRLIIVDATTVWLLTQSLNAFAQRSPATIQRSDADTAALKVQAYYQLWQHAPPIG